MSIEEKKEKGRLLRQNMKAAFKTVMDTKTKTVSTVVQLLEVFTGKECPIRENLFPRELFVMEQVALTAKDYINRLQKQTMTFLDLREDLGNLTCLCELMANRDERATLLAHVLLRRLIVIVSELAGIIEEASGMTRTNWNAVIALHPKGATLTSLESFAHLVPALSYIQSGRLLGTGGFGSIYRVLYGGSIVMTGKLVRTTKFNNLKHACADKVCGSIIACPFLVMYFCCFKTDMAFVTLMEYIRGVDLNKVSNRRRTLPPPVVKLILAQLGLAVHYLHCKGFVHRDVKPSNVMISPGCRIKLIDLDTCKICTGRFCDGLFNSYIRKTYREFDDEETAGTLSYLAPEVLFKKPYGRAVDWWAIGVTAFQLYTGRVPFRGHNEAVTKILIKRGVINFDDGAHDPQLEALIVKLANKSMAARITSAKFSLFKTNEYFNGMDWPKLSSEVQLYNLQAIIDLMSITDNGEYSPKPELAINAMNHERKATSFGEINNSTDQVPLFTFCTGGFQRSLVKLNSGQTIKGADIFEPTELVPEAHHFSKYKFKEFLLKKNSDAVSTSVKEHSDLTELRILTSSEETEAASRVICLPGIIRPDRLSKTASNQTILPLLGQPSTKSTMQTASEGAAMCHIVTASKPG